MRILVVCGAGASSTFVAQRLRRAVTAAGLAWTTAAGTEQTLAAAPDSADLVLVGPHIGTRVAEIEKAVSPYGARAVLLPPDIFSDLDGARTLALVRAEAAPSTPPKGTP